MANNVLCVVGLLLCFNIALTVASIILGNGQFINPNEQNTIARNVAELNSLAVKHMKSDEFNTAAKILQDALKLDPKNVDSNQLLGTLILKGGQDKAQSLEYFEKAITYSNGEDVTLFSNYIEALRTTRKLQEAHEFGMKLINNGIVKPNPETCTFYLNLGIVERLMANYDLALQLLDVALQCDINLLNAWVNTAEVLTDMSLYVESEALLKKSLSYFPDESYLYFLLGTAVHHQQKLDQALQLYLHAEKLNPNYTLVKANIAAALQGLGRAAEALYYYESVLPSLPNDAGIRNNYGALLGTMNRKDEEVYWLKQALEIEPNLEHALVNLAGYYQDEGLLEEATGYLTRAIQSSKTSSTLLKLRLSLMMSPIAISWKQMILERNRMKNNLLALKKEILTTTNFPKVSLDTSLDRIHFYVPYHGLNDRALEELIVEVYNLHLYEIQMMAPNIINSFLHQFYTIDTLNSQQIQSLMTTTSIPAAGKSIFQSNQYLQRKRIGFMSKFFGIFEPHGMLLDGIMKYLPRNQFHVVCMLIARSDGKPPAPSVIESCDEIHEISLSYQHAYEIIKQLSLDILIFADLVSEPINHFMALQRLAPIQMAFWGNPITSGSDTIDYFLSAEIMEHPYRTRLLPLQDAYTEQVILTEGQGIWYFQPIDPHIELQKVNISHLIGAVKTYTRQDFQLSNDWFIYLLPQSVFKIHPLYDIVLASILQQNPNSHLLITGGRRPRWTKLYVQRLQYTLGPILSQRLHLIERVSSENFYNLLTLANVILHPFPFDGSRTSADALIANIPFVTMPSEYLRGRMGFTFLRTMNIPELVATNVQQYIDISVRLSYDSVFLQQMKDRIAKNVHLIWEDMEVPYTWTRLLQRISGLSIVKNYDQFLQQCELQDKTRLKRIELEKSLIRKQNQLAFDTIFPSQLWTLMKDDKQRSYVQLESFLPSEQQWPLLFESWKQYKLQQERPQDLFFIEVLHRIEALGKEGLIASDNNFFEKFSAFTGWINDNTINNNNTNTPPPRKSSSISSARGSSSRSRGMEQQATLSQQQQQQQQDLPSASTITIGSSISSPLEKHMNTFHTAIKQGQFTQAKEIGKEIQFIYQRHQQKLSQDYALFLVEYGGVYYLSGEYKDGKEYCEEAITITKQSNHAVTPMMYACIGMSSMYLPGYEQYSLQYLRLSYQTILSSPSNSTDTSTAGLFTVTKESLESSLFTSLHQYQQYEECLIFTKQMIARTLPTSLLATYHTTSTASTGLDEVEIYLLVFSAIDWSPSNYHYLSQLDILLQQQYPRYQQYKQQQHGLTSFREEIALIQHHFAHVLGSILSCIQEHSHVTTATTSTSTSSSSASAQIFPQVIDTMIQIIGNIQQDTTPPSSTTKRPKIVLITQYFQSPNPMIQDTINQALTKNLINPYIHEIIQLLEDPLPSNYFHNTFPQSANKLKQYHLGHRLQFADVFQFANDYLTKEKQGEEEEVIVILANADIYFDYSLSKLLTIPYTQWQSSQSHSQPLVYTLLKWIDHQQYLSLPLRIDSQDVWIFTPPISASIISQSHFALGLPRCDNRIAEIFAQANYTIQNPAFDIHGIEIQQQQQAASGTGSGGAATATAGRRNIYGMGNAVSGTGRLVFIQDQLVV